MNATIIVFRRFSFMMKSYQFLFSTILLISANIAVLGQCVTLYTTTGGGSTCGGANSVTIMLTYSSQIGVNYQLVLNGSELNPPKAGTGAPLSWSVTSPGTYQIIGKKSGCTNLMMSGNAVVTSTSTPTPGIAVSGNGCSTVLTGSGGTSYKWRYGSATGNIIGTATTYAVKQSGIYYLTVTNSCNNSAQTSYTVSTSTISAVNISSSGPPNSTCPGVITLTGTGGSNYVWTLPNSTTATTASISATLAGTYTLNANNPCGIAETKTIPVTFNTIASTPNVSNVKIAHNTSKLLSVIGAQPGETFYWYNASQALIGAGNSYLTPVLTNTTTYYVSKNSSGLCESPKVPLVVTVNRLPVVSAGVDKVLQLPSNKVTLAGTATDADGDVLTYTWMRQSGESTHTAAGSSTLNLSLTWLKGGTYVYRLSVNDGWNTVYDETQVTLNFPANNYNYIKEQTVAVPNVTPESIGSLPIGPRLETVKYFDVLGRAMQTVTTQGSPLQKDIVLPIAYDDFGREAVKFIPYTSTQTTGFFNNNTLLEQASFYNPASVFPNIAGDLAPFAQTIFESSPLNRVIKQGSSGTSWQPDNTYTYNSSDHTIRFAYELNTSNEVLLWSYVYPDVSNPFGKVNASTGATPVYYAANQLYKSKTKDEQQHEVIEFKDKQGKVILKKVQADNSGYWAQTYYIYNIFNQLVCIIPPEATKLITKNPSDYFNKSDAEKNAFLNAWAFRYTYDARNRMSEKQVPGAGAVYMVYDNRDRLVLTQDANQRAGATNAIKYWTFTKYDELNRPILTGIKDTTTNVQLTQVEMQSAVDAHYAKAWTKYGETYLGNVAGNVHGYSNKSYPVFTSAATLDPNRYLTVTYYDTYDFKSLWTGSYSYVDENLSNVVNGITYTLPDAEFTSVKGQVTGTKIKVLDGGVAGGYTWLKSVNYYDDDYRVIQTLSDNYKGGTDRVTSLYDFTGKVLKTKSTHTQADLVWKDLVSATTIGNRLVSVGSPVGWGGSGAASVQQLASGENGWVEFTASAVGYNWMLGLSDQNTDANFTSLDYAWYLGTSSLTVRESGVARSFSGTYAPGDVLRIERTGTTIKYYQNGILRYTSAVPSSTVLMVDVAMEANSNIVGVRSSFSATSQIITRKFDYDHAGRLLNTWHQLDSGPEILLVKNEYNELSQLTDKKLHSTQADASDAKQSVDYRYNIRGWLTKMNDAALSDNTENVNDLFGMELTYNEISDIGNTALYNGNISGVKWSNNLGLGDLTENAYTYSYDALNRIIGSVYKQKHSTWAALGDSRNAESGFAYDLNGNITTLKRNDNRTSGPIMDDLVYSYGTSYTQSNKLLKVTDDGDDYKGFTDGTNTGNDYSYDANGNMTLDYNKGVTTAIIYNYLNLPEVVTRGGGTNNMRYIYDATGRKLAQVISLTGLPKQTEYVGEFIYENDVLQFISHEEGRTVVAQEEKIYAFDGSHQNGITTTANVSLSHETIGEEQYLKVTAAAGSALTKQGIISVGGTFTVAAGEKYVLRVKGYRSSELVNLNVKGNGTDLLWPAAQLTAANGHRNDVWVETFFTIPSGITSIELGVLWNSSATTAQYFYINEIELVRLAAQLPEYQYNLKDHLGNVRLTFTTKESTQTETATLEAANAVTEQGQFLRLGEARKVQSYLFDRTSGSAPSVTNGYAQRLNGSANEKYGLGKSISVMPGDIVHAQVYAKYIDPVNTNWTTALSNLLGQIAGGTAPTGTVIDGIGYNSSTVNFPFPVAAAQNTAGSSDTGPKVYLNWLVFDRNYNFIARESGYDRLSIGPKELGQDVAHELLESPNITIKQPGYIYIYLSNEESSLLEAYFDDFVVTYTKSPVIQQDDYYAFGLNFNSYQREDTKKNNYLYNNGIERQDDLHLSVDLTFFRTYDPSMGRWWQIDPKVDNMEGWTPYNYTFNNPIRYNDPKGDCPPGVDCAGLIALASADAAVNPNGVGAHALGVAQGLKNSATGLYNAVTNPVQTLKGLGNLALAGLAGNPANAMQMDAALGTNSLGTMNGLNNAVSKGVNNLINGDGVERGTVLGEIVGTIIGSKGLGALKGTFISTVTIGEMSTLFHSTSRASAATSILSEGINPSFFNSASRFGKGFYLSNNVSTTGAELAYHGSSVTSTIQFSLGAGGKFLNATSPALSLGVKYTPSLLGGAARGLGYNGIVYNSLRSSGTNLTLFNNFSLLKNGKIIP